MDARRLKCTACGSTEFETDTTRGDTFCVKCGLVVEESTIVSEVTFVEGADGSTSVVGQFLPSSGRPSYTGRSRGGLESREETIERGRRRIQNVASMLSLTQHIMDAAQRIFMLALQHGFMQGRKSDHVVAACLYIACRREKSPRMCHSFTLSIPQ
jgi:transcription factor IIIB 90 kDa subunit